MINIIIPVFYQKNRKEKQSWPLSIVSWILRNGGNNQESIIILSQKKEKKKRVLLVGDRSGQLSSKKYRASCVYFFCKEGPTQ